MDWVKFFARGSTMKFFRTLLMLSLFCFSSVYLNSEGVRHATYRDIPFIFDGMAFENTIRTDPEGSNDNTTVAGTLTPLEFGLIYQMQFLLALDLLRNLIAPADVVKDDTVEIELETFDAGLHLRRGR
jgi:hypothetical protein